MYNTLDLKNLYNHRMFYPRSTVVNTDIIGIDNFYINQEDITFDKILIRDNKKIVFNRNNDLNDNIIPLGQEIILDKAVEFKKITIFGFSSFGMYTELIKLIDENNKIYHAGFHFNDLCWAVNEFPTFDEDEADIKDGAKVFMEFSVNNRGDGVRPAYLYYYATDFADKIKLKHIIFPDNCFMNIFAITLED